MQFDGLQQRKKFKFTLPKFLLCSIALTARHWAGGHPACGDVGAVARVCVIAHVNKINIGPLA
jgi:hypothetical protein